VDAMCYQTCKIVLYELLSHLGFWWDEVQLGNASAQQSRHLLHLEISNRQSMHQSMPQGLRLSWKLSAEFYVCSLSILSERFAVMRLWELCC
jgi:hypothetical protein